MSAGRPAVRIEPITPNKPEGTPVMPIMSPGGSQHTTASCRRLEAKSGMA